MNILSVDTTTGICSVAIISPGKEPIEIIEETASKQAEMLVPMIEQVLADASLEYKDIDLLVSTIGPGSFTGLRIGIAAIKGISIATKIPAVGVNTLETMAWQGRSHKNITAVLNAMRGQVYTQSFRHIDNVFQKTSEPELIQVEDLSNHQSPITNNYVVCTNCANLIKHNAEVIDVVPKASTAGELALHKKNTGDKLLGLEPLYIRKPDAKLPG